MSFAMIIGALIGYQMGKFPGLLIGAFAGYMIARALKKKVRQSIGKLQSGFTEPMFAVMGALCKADGVVTQDEIRMAETLFDRFRLTGVQREQAKNAFNRGKAADFDLDAELAAFYGSAATSLPCFSCSCRYRCRRLPLTARCTRRSTRCWCESPAASACRKPRSTSWKPCSVGARPGAPARVPGLTT